MRHASREPQRPRDGVWLVDLIPPVAAPRRDDGEFDQNDGTTDGRSYLLGALTPR